MRSAAILGRWSLPSVTVRVLGAVEMVDASGEVRDVPGRRLQTLLARLVSQSGQIVSVDALVDAVWPDGLPDSPDAALQTQVFRLRKRLRFPGAPTVATRAPGYVLELGSATRRRDRVRTSGSSRDRGRTVGRPRAACTTRCPCGGVRRTPGSRMSRRCGPSRSGWRSSISKRSRRTPKRCWPAVSRTAPSRSWTRSCWSTRCAPTRKRP